MKRIGAGVTMIGAEEFWSCFSYVGAIHALREAFIDGWVRNPAPSLGLPLSSGELLVMASRNPADSAGVKVLSLTPGNVPRGRAFINGIYVQFDRLTNEVTAVFDGAALTAGRTAAVSAVASERLARKGAETLVVIGAGAQARAHVNAITRVLPIAKVAVIDNDPVRAESLAAHARAQRLDAFVDHGSAIAAADVICTCTNASRPLFESERLKDGVHINAIGGYTPQHRELDGPLMAHSRVVVETRELALRESGDIILAQAEGHLEAEFMPLELSDVLGPDGPDLRDTTTVFESIGMASEDLVVAADFLARHRGPGSARFDEEPATHGGDANARI